MTYQAEVLADSPIAFYRFTSNTDLSDSSGHGYSGYWSGSPSSHGVSPTGGAIVVTTPAQGILSTGANFTDSVATQTVEGWFRAAGPTLNYCLFAQGGVSAGWGLFVTAAEGIMFRVFGHKKLVATDASGVHAILTDGAWHHIAATYDRTGGTGHLYLDGVEVASTATALAGTVDGGVYPTIGCAATGGGASSYMVGALAEPAWYPTVLSAARIAAHYAEAPAPCDVGGLIRIKEVSTTGSSVDTSLTATFDESTPLDDTHLLVAIIAARSGTAPATITAPAGWTLGASSGVVLNAGRQNIYSRQGDGVTNSIAFTFALGTDACVELMAFEGFVSETPAVSSAATGGSGTAATIPLSTKPDICGVVIGSVSLAPGVTASNSWSNLYTNQASSDRQLRAARKAYMGPAGSYDTVATWGTTRAYKGMINVFELTVPTPPVVIPEAIEYAHGAVPLTVSLGSVPVDIWLGAGAP